MSKWKVKYETEGIDSLAMGYQGSESYLSEQERAAMVAWIKGQVTLSVEQVRDYLAATYGGVYQSKQSYYDLLELGGMSYHKSEKQNPKRDEEQVQARREDIKKTGTLRCCHPARRSSGVARGRMPSALG